MKSNDMTIYSVTPIFKNNLGADVRGITVHTKSYKTAIDLIETMGWKSFEIVKTERVYKRIVRSPEIPDFKVFQEGLE
jgi:hypothetical protein